MISQIFVLSLRGDNIIFRDYRGDVPKASAEIFFRKAKFWDEGEDNEEAPPIFHVDGVNYFHMKMNALYFVATTCVNCPPCFILEILQRIARVIKDYLGVLNEEALRRNFILVYELLDEMIDFGYPQQTSTEALKSLVFNEPVVVNEPRMTTPNLFMQQGAKRMPATAVTKSVVAKGDPSGRRREEVFVDIIEKINVTFNASGYVLTCEVDGTIQMKSYLTGNPEVRLALNEDLILGRGEGSSTPSLSNNFSSAGGGGPVQVDDCNFHESVRLDDFDIDRTLTLIPPDGEFPVMNYRMTQEFKVPFKVYPSVEEAGPFRAELRLKVKCDFPAQVSANSVVFRIPLPKSTIRVSTELQRGVGGQSSDYKEATKTLEWTCDKMVGGSDFVMTAKITMSQERAMNLRKEVGPVSMSFTIPMFNCSRLQVRYLQIMKKSKAYNPYRWVRYVTHSNSYVVRI